MNAENQYKNIIESRISAYMYDPEVKAMPCICDVIENCEQKMIFQITDIDLSQYEYVQGFLASKDSYKLCDIVNEANKCTFIVPDMSETVKFIGKKKWTIGFVAIKGQQADIYRFKKNKSSEREKTFYTPIQSMNYMDENIVFVLYETAIGNLAIMQMLDVHLYNNQISANMTEFSIKRGILRCTVEVDDDQKDWNGFYFVFRSKTKEDRKQFLIPIKDKVKIDGGMRLSIEMRVKDYEFKPIFWDIKPAFDLEGKTYMISTKCNVAKFQRQFIKIFQDNYVKLDDGLVIFPYVTGADSIALLCREKSKYDGMLTRIKERIARKYYNRNKKSLNAKKIYIVYEKYSEMAQDNGYYFFKYCMEHNMEEKTGAKFYYVINKKASDYEKVKQYGNKVLSFMSLKFMIMMLASRALISSDTKVHVYAWRSRPSIIRPLIQKKKMVFLQHGVTAFKRVDSIYDKYGSNPCDLFVVTSDFEKEIIEKYFHYQEDEIAVTGFARWDVLHDCSEGRRDILMMPTWRNWLDSATEDDFKKSDYYKHYMDFINSDRLAKLLDEQDVNFNFYIHPKFREYISSFSCKSDRVRIIPYGEEPLNELMMQCKLLITDYSSVAWDVYYQGKPVLFYQFDIDTYNEAHGSYLDMDTELFGDRAMTADQLIDLIEKNIAFDFKLEEKYEKLRSGYFKYIDDDNSKRICELIEKKNWQL